MNANSNNKISNAINVEIQEFRNKAPKSLDINTNRHIEINKRYYKRCDNDKTIEEKSKDNMDDEYLHCDNSNNSDYRC